MDQHELDADVEERLRASRPEPDPGFVAELAARLFRRPRRHRSPVSSRRPIWAAAGVAAAMACAALLLGLTGAGPLAGGQHATQAKDDCRFVAVKRLEQEPVVVRTANGTRLEFRKRLVTRQVKRCS
jgi:hypothetical protein